MDYTTAPSEVAEFSDILPALAIGGITILFMIMWIAMFLIPFYVYKSLAWMKIAQKLGYQNTWLAWVPFGRTILVLQLGNYPWELVFLYLLPIIGWIAIYVIIIICQWRIFEKRNYPGALALIQLGSLLGSILGILSFLFAVGSLVILGLVAWKDQPAKELKEPSAPVPTPPATSI